MQSFNCNSHQRRQASAKLLDLDHNVVGVNLVRSVCNRLVFFASNRCRAKEHQGIAPSQQEWKGLHQPLGLLCRQNCSTNYLGSDLVDTSVVQFTIANPIADHCDSGESSRASRTRPIRPHPPSQFRNPSSYPHARPRRYEQHG